MKISYKNSLQDIIDLTIYYNENFSGNKKGLRILQLSIPLLLIFYYILLYINYYEVSPILLIGALIFSILWVMFYPKFHKRSILRIITKQVNEFHDKNVYDDVTLTLDDEGITKESKLMYSKVSWLCIKKVTVTEKDIFIFVNNASAIIIPLNVFNSITEKDSFIEFIYRNANK